MASCDRFGGDCIKRLEYEGKREHDNYIGIGHTRWATHGDKTDVNAHPHFDHKDRLALVHNGIISNYFELKQQLATKYNIIPKSQTDTEICAIYIGIYLDEGLSLFDAIKKAVEVLEGAYSFLLISVLDPEAMYVVKNTGTVIIGFPHSLAKGNKSTEGSSGEASPAHGLESISDMSSEKQKEKVEDEEIHKFQIVASDTTVF